MAIVKSALTVSAYTGISRIFGYIRDILIATTLGASAATDAFFVAFRFPNFFRQISAEGAFNAAFVPLFSGKMAAENKQKAIAFAEQVYALMLFILLGFTLLVELCMPALMYLMAPGFLQNPEQFDRTITLTRITFPYLLFISLTSLFAGMLNSIGKFAAPAATPILLNICMISSLLLFHHNNNLSVFALTWSIALAGLVQFIWLFSASKYHGISIKLRKPVLNSQVKTLLKRMVPGIIGGGVTQFHILINTVIATFLTQAVTYLYFADRFVQLPLALIGTAMGVALLPTLSKQFKLGDKTGAYRTQNHALEATLFLVFPAALALFVLAHPIISVMIGHGDYDHTAITATANALAAYAFGLPAFVLIKIFTTTFFANGDTKTPVKIAISCLIINVALNLALMIPFKHVGLAMGTTISSWINAILLCTIATKHQYYQANTTLKPKLLSISLASLVMGCALWWCHQQLNSYTNAEQFLIQGAALTALIIIGLLTFFTTILLLRSYTLKSLKELLKL